jgi:hypothetical protein
VRNRPLPLALSVLLLLVARAPGAAQNLITNPELDSSIANWYFDTNAGQAWLNEDADHCPFSGLLTGISAQTSPNFWGFSTRPMDQIPVIAGETVYASIRFRSPGATFGRLYLVYCTDSANCGTSSAILDFAAGSLAWLTLEASDVIPAGVTLVFLAIDASSGTGSFAIDVDSAYFGRQPRIFNDSFEQSEACRWEVQDSR